MLRDPHAALRPDVLVLECAAQLQPEFAIRARQASRIAEIAADAAVGDPD